MRLTVRETNAAAERLREVEESATTLAAYDYSSEGDIRKRDNPGFPEKS